MKHRIALGASLAVAMLCSYAIAKGTLKSGPQVGESMAKYGPFNVLNACNAEVPKNNGKKTCLV